MDKKNGGQPEIYYLAVNTTDKAHFFINSLYTKNSIQNSSTIFTWSWSPGKKEAVLLRPLSYYYPMNPHVTCKG